MVSSFRRLGMLAMCGIVIVAVFIGQGNVVLADSFYPGGDAGSCDFAYTESLSIGYLPAQGVGESGGIAYSGTLVTGEREGFVGGKTFNDLAEVRYPNSRRYMGVADSVSVPPRARVDVGFYTNNYSGHGILLKNGFLYTSSNDGSGSYMRLGATGIYKESSYLINGVNVVRKGYGVDVPVEGYYQSHSLNYPPKGKVVYSFEVAQPIVFDKPVLTEIYSETGMLQLHVSQRVSNNSEVELDIKYVHNEFEQNARLSAHGEFTFEHNVFLGSPYSLEGSLGFSTVSVLTSVKECIASGGVSNVNYSPDARSLVVLRDDFGAPLSWGGSQVDFPFVPSGATLCITRIPFQINSDDLVYKIEPRFVLEANLSDLDEKATKSIKTDEGSEFEINIKVGNVGANASGVGLSFNLDTGYSVLRSSCELVSDEYGINYWEIGQLNHGETVECRVVVRAPAPLREVVTSSLLVNVQSDDVNQKYDVLTVVVNPLPEVSLSKVASVQSVKDGEELVFTITIVNEKIALQDVKLVDVCDNCSMLVKVSEDGDLPLNQPFNIPLGVYQTMVKYDVNAGSSRQIRNCVRLQKENVSIAESCVLVDYLGMETAMDVIEYTSKEFEALVPIQMIIDLSFGGKDELRAYNAKEDIVDYPVKVPQRDSLVFTGNVDLITTTFFASVVLVSCVVFRRYFW